MKIPTESLEAAGRQLRINLSLVFIIWLPGFSLLAGKNKFSHFILGAAANDMVALLQKKIFWWHLRLASWLLFPDDSYRPGEILKWLFGFTKGASTLGYFPGIWGMSRWPECFSQHSLEAALCLAIDVKAVCGAEWAGLASQLWHKYQYLKFYWHCFVFRVFYMYDLSWFLHSVRQAGHLGIRNVFIIDEKTEA